ncbi:MAG: hypothetical protein LC104_03205 [Bacteroidales bacterium]|nr:hypothetical protein [Bacteroidales bacterium]
MSSVKQMNKESRQRRFLECFRLKPNIAIAARMAGVPLVTVHLWIRTDTEFAERWQEVDEQAYLANRERVLAELEAGEKQPQGV